MLGLWKLVKPTLVAWRSRENGTTITKEDIMTTDTDTITAASTNDANNTVSATLDTAPIDGGATITAPITAPVAVTVPSAVTDTHPVQKAATLVGHFEKLIKDLHPSRELEYALGKLHELEHWIGRHFTKNAK